MGTLSSRRAKSNRPSRLPRADTVLALPEVVLRAGAAATIGNDGPQLLVNGERREDCR